MKFDQKKLTRLRTQRLNPAAMVELYRHHRIFQVAVDAPMLLTLEAVLESESRQPVELFRLHFMDEESFFQGQDLVRQLKKNFHGFLFGAFAEIPTTRLIDHAYAAGLDLIHMPLTGDDSRQWVALNYARTVFPSWSVLAGVSVWPQSDAPFSILARRGIVPWIDLEKLPADIPDEILCNSFKALLRNWQEFKIKLKPLYPLLKATLPFSPPPRSRGLSGLIELADDVALRTGLDLRRLLRVRGVADSFESAGL